MIRQPPPFRLQNLENLLGKRPDAPVAGLTERQIEFAVGADRPHVAGDHLADLERSREVVVVNQAPVGVVHDQIVAEGTFACDKQLDGFTLVIVGRGEIQPAVQPGARHEAVGLLIQCDLHHHPVTRVHRAVHFPDRQQEILLEAPVQKDPDARTDGGHLQAGKLADDGERLLSRRDEPVLGVAVDEDLDLTARRGARRDIASRQQDFPMRAAIQVKPGLGGADDGKQVAFAYKCHDARNVYATPRQGEPILRQLLGPR